MSNQLKGGSYEINAQSEAVQKAGTIPATRNAPVKPAEQAAAKRAGAGKTTSNSKG